ncbi:hypothetical protein GCM10008906_21300 [Clostridium oceanicum]|uniref:Uncharacterized protein n=1 Tax=Clostridium oceanicum TaxID=1543 RepID=A0ABP3UTK2_9CLOT
MKKIIFYNTIINIVYIINLQRKEVLNMLPIKMSDLAYNEFKNMLDSNNINSNILRVYLEGSG